MAAAKPRALVFGHSFVRRMGEFIDKSQPKALYCRDFHLANVCEVNILGIGGRTVDKAIRFDLDNVKSHASNLIVLEMGSNDARDSACDAESTAWSLVALAELLLSECKIQFIVVCQILPRKRPPFEGYNERVGQINSIVCNKLQSNPRAKFWRHRGLIDPAVDIYLDDGIHLNEVGNRALYKSYRGAILFALSELQ